MSDWSNFICVDFDGTIVEHEFPIIGKPVPLAIETLKELTLLGHKIILFTMRSDRTLAKAVDYLTKNDIHLYGINVNPTQSQWTNSPKAFGHIYIDDAALGCPLMNSDTKYGRKYVDWKKVRELLSENHNINLRDL